MAVEQCIGIMNKVYGNFTTVETWRPKPFSATKGRYLWTDAYGVCNFISLFYETGAMHFLEQADALIKDVHDSLGKTRDLSSRLGQATDEHPLLGGLRIGKEKPEGLRDGDGQYYHYLTKWAFALNCMSKARGDAHYNELAVELIKAIHPHFVFERDSARPTMVWKTSIDLTTPVVHSEGNLDPFDGYATYRIIQNNSEIPSVLEREINELKRIVDLKYTTYTSDDPLDLGETLWITHFFIEEIWAKSMASAAYKYLEQLWQHEYFDMPLGYRLAFREFGTTLGVQVNSCEGKNAKWQERNESLYKDWLPKLYDRDNDITPVMFCSSLLPGVLYRDYPRSPAIITTR